MLSGAPGFAYELRKSGLSGFPDEAPDDDEPLWG